MKASIILLALSALVLVAQAKREPKFAPYIFTGQDLAGLKSKYGLKAVTLAFVLARGGCNPSWDGQKDINDKDSVAKIMAFKNAGGDIIVATGGALGNYIENNCHSVAALAGAYKKALAAARSTHLDIDIETAIPIDTVTQAVAQVQKSNPAITFSLTVGADASGITAQGMNILRSAVKHGVNVDIVNAMAMDFQSAKAWGGAVADVGEALHRQLKQIWPHKSDKELYSMIGLTPMIGRNDSGKTFTLDDAHKVVSYAKSKGVGHLAFWSLGRDNGRCPGAGAASGTCSGIAENDHAFTKIFNTFA